MFTLYETTYFERNEIIVHEGTAVSSQRRRRAKKSTILRWESCFRPPNTSGLVVICVARDVFIHSRSYCSKKLTTNVRDKRVSFLEVVLSREARPRRRKRRKDKFKLDNEYSERELLVGMSDFSLWRHAQNSSFLIPSVYLSSCPWFGSPVNDISQGDCYVGFMLVAFSTSDEWEFKVLEYW